MESIVRNRVKDRYIEVSLLIPALFFFPLPPSNNINIKTEQRGYKLELTLWCFGFVTDDRQKSEVREMLDPILLEIIKCLRVILNTSVIDCFDSQDVFFSTSQALQLADLTPFLLCLIKINIWSSHMRIWFCFWDSHHLRLVQPTYSRTPTSSTPSSVHSPWAPIKQDLMQPKFSQDFPPPLTLSFSSPYPIYHHLIGSQVWWKALEPDLI